MIVPKSMKYSKILALLVLGLLSLSLIFVSGCDRRTDNPVRPDFTNPFWLDNFDYALSIGVVSAKERSSSVLRSITEPISPTLSLSGGSAIAGNVAFNSLDDYWYVTFPFSSGFSGAVVEYELKFSGKRYTGNLVLPTSMSAAFPFFLGQNDYSFSWATATNPHAFIASLDYVYEGNFSYIRKQIIGTQRTYTMPKSLWNGNAIDVQNLSIRAMNYNTRSKNLIVYGQTSASY